MLSKQTYRLAASWASGGDYTDFFNLRKRKRTDCAQFYVTDGSRQQRLGGARSYAESPYGMSHITTGALPAC